MASPIKRFKDRLSHVNDTSWHYHLFTEIWQKKASRSVRLKACTYYWFYIPTTLLVVGFIYLVLALLTVFGFFFGFRPKYGDEADSLFYPYKVKKDGRKRRFAPWEIVLIILVGLGAYWFVGTSINHPHTIKIIGIILFGIFAFCAFAWFFLKGWSTPLIKETRGIAKTAISSWWDKTCPVLVVDESEKSDDTTS